MFNAVNVCLLLQVLMVIVRVAFYTLLERKLLGYQQIRKGPNKPRAVGLVTPIADAIKLIRKEFNYPAIRNKRTFILTPAFTLTIPLALWGTFPTRYESIVFKYAALYFLSVSALGVFAILAAGWSGNRKYRFLGSIRAVAQSVSYEVGLTIIVLHAFLFFYFSLLNVKIRPLIGFLFGCMSLFLVTAYAETNRTPFDLSEGESELVSGFNTEFSSNSFLMIFLAEYISILYLSAVLRLLYAGTSHFDLIFFFMLTSISFIWSRGTLPRFRYDQLMHFAWKTILPAALCLLALSSLG